MPEHGGDVARAAREHGIPVERWLDLSTGINPFGYPVPQLSVEDWRRLPAHSESLERAASDYYGNATLLAVAGSQAAIALLPRLRPRSRVMVATLTYGEYTHVWRRHGHAVQTVPSQEFDERLGDADVLVVCNPNNPTGERFAPELLLDWHARLAVRGGWLVVDEAYVDATLEASIAGFANRRGLIVLRSVGKFFGLAGARVGFVFAERALLDAMADELGPWTVSGPAQAAASAALCDRAWQAETRIQLVRSIERLEQVLSRAGIVTAGTELFRWWRDERAEALHLALARQAILTRLFREAHGVRIGLPGAENDWTRLAQALALWKERQCA